MGENEIIHLKEVLDQRFNNAEKDIKVLYKKYESLESMKDILIELKIISANSEIANKQRDEMVREQSKLLQEQSITLTKVNDSLDMLKNEIDETKRDLKGLDDKITKKSEEKEKSLEKTSAFKDWVYNWGLKVLEFAILGGLAYYFIKK